MANFRIVKMKHSYTYNAYKVQKKMLCFWLDVEDMKYKNIETCEAFITKVIYTLNCRRQAKKDNPRDIVIKTFKN